MKFEIKTSKLTQALKKSSLIVERNMFRETGSIKIDAIDGKIIISATDLENAFVGEYEANVEINGSISVDGRKLLQISSSYPDDKLKIECGENDNMASIGDGSVKYHLLKYDIEKFPEIQINENIQFFDIGKLDLLRMISSITCINVENSDKRAHIRCAKLTCVDGKLVSFGTNGGALAHTQIDGDFSGIDCLVPKYGIQSISKIIDSDVIKIGVNEKQLIVNSNKETFATTMATGDFPDVGKFLLETEYKFRISVDTKKMLQTLSRMGIMAKDGDRACPCELIFSENEISAKISNPEVGESSESIDCIGSADSLSAYYNVFTMSSLFGDIQSEKTVMLISDYGGMMLLPETKNCGFQSRYVIMPMRS